MGGTLGTPTPPPPPTLSTYHPQPAIHRGLDASVSSSFEGYYIANYSIHRVNRAAVVFYHIEMHGGTTVKRRFNDFKAFHHATESIARCLPPLPCAGWRTALHRLDPYMIQERCIQFQHLLNAAPQDRVDIFLAPRRSKQRPFSRLWCVVRTKTLWARHWFQRRRVQFKRRSRTGPKQTDAPTANRFMTLSLFASARRKG